MIRPITARVGGAPRQAQGSSNTDSDSEDDFGPIERQMIESYLTQGYKIARKDEAENLLTLERPDEIKLRGRRPAYDKFRQTTSLNFGGRVKMTSKKNAQLETKMKLDNKLKCVLQHGKFNKEIFILDYGYPLSPV